MIRIKNLNGGVRLVTEKLEGFHSASIGIWVGAGAVCETPRIAGISHFIEHMFFKGTETRSARALAEDIDRLGASVNAFTGREATCFHAKALTEVFPETTALLLDMLTHSRFDEKDIRRERKVILEEKSMVEDTPDDYVIDLTCEKVFAGSPLQNSIIGSVRSLHAIRRGDILDYIRSRYAKDRIVVSAVGDFDEGVLQAQLEEALAGFAAHAPETDPGSIGGKPRYRSLARDINQTHLALGIPTYSLGDDRYYAQAVVSDVLGGSMSSMLFQKLREEMGLAYSVYCAPLAYAAGGMLYIYAGITQGREQEALRAAAGELSALAKTAVSEETLSVVKQRLKSGFIFGLESTNNRMLRNGKNLLLLDRVYTPEETLAEIDAVTTDDVAAVCEQLGDIRRYSAAMISREKLDARALLMQSVC